MPQRVRGFDSWTAFLIMLFAVVGLCGLFASYATSIPLERGLSRSAVLDQVLIDDRSPNRTELLENLRPSLDNLAAVVLDSGGPIDTRVQRARAVVLDEQRRESSSLAYRSRLLLGVVTSISAFIAAGILALARRTTTAT